MKPEIVADPAQMETSGSTAGLYTAALARDGTARYVSNATSQMRLLRHGGREWPITVDDGGYGRSYVSSPHSAYVLYAREEMDLVGMTRGRWAAGAALTALDLILRAARINRVVHLDNWLLSTNLHGDWKGEGLSDLRQALSVAYPDHFLALRTLDGWSCPDLLEAARTDGWILIPARQVWVVDDLSRDWAPRSNHANDRRAVARSGLTLETLDRCDAEDRARIVDLYRRLYVDRYSALNPIFSDAFIELTFELGLVQYRVARDGDGQILCVAGVLERSGIVTPSVVGYDTSRPQTEALYRIATVLFSEWAMTRGLKLHGSAGAGDFKRRRGAHGVIEYLAIHAGHLSTARRATVIQLAQALERHIVPMMKREGW